MLGVVRNSSLDLLRIVAMGMIISMHYVGHGGGDTEAYGSIAYTEAWFIKSFVSVGVNCYILITGYFLINSSKISFAKIFRIWGLLFTYSIGFYFLFFLMGDFAWSWKEFLKAFLPIKGNAYWFGTMYIGLYLLHPYLNRMITGGDKIDARKLIGVLIALFSVYSFVGDTYQAHSGFSLAWFVVVYLVGAYIRLFEKDNNSSCIYVCIYMSCCLMMYLSSLFFLKFFTGTTPNYDLLSILYKYNSPVNLIASIALFLIFTQIKIASKRISSWVNFFAPLTFGVYLIHDNILVREHLWHQWLYTQIYYDSDFYFLHWGISVIGVFLLCSLLEWGRRYLAKILFNRVRI